MIPEEGIYRLLFERAAQGVVLQQDDKIILANQSFADMVGYTIAELLAFSAEDVLKLIHPQDRETALTWIRDPLADENLPKTADYRFVRRDGTIGWWSATVSTLDYENKPAILGIFADITEHKKTDESVERSNQLLTDILNVLPVGVCLTDEGGYYRMMNDAYCATYEYNRDEMLGQHYSVIMPPDQIALANAHYARLLGGDVGIPVERKRQRKDGTLVYIEAANALVKDVDGRTLVITTVRDITERTRARAELQTRNDDLNAFAHTVAHDLKNPLAVMSGYAELLYDEYKTLQPAEVERYLSAIVKHEHKMQSIVDELLLLSSVRDVEQVTTSPLDMSRIVAAAQENLRELIDTYQVEIDLPAQWPIAVGYAPWVEQVWVNYLSNALKYGGSPPRLKLGADERAAGQIRFWVKDNGRGLTPDEQVRVFQPFERLGRQRMTGHGLGLSIVRRIVEKLGGEVGVESEIGQGSTFYFTLPKV